GIGSVGSDRLGTGDEDPDGLGSDTDGSGTDGTGSDGVGRLGTGRLGIELGVGVGDAGLGVAVGVGEGVGEGVTAGPVTTTTGGTPRSDPTPVQSWRVEALEFQLYAP